MMLPPKALTILIDLKKELLSAAASEMGEPVEAPKKPRVRPSRKKLGPQRVNGFQRMCQRRDWASPVYLILFSLLLHGCAPHHPKAGYPAPIPGCAGAIIYVSDGCRMNDYPEYVEVDCPQSTTKYMRCKRAQ